MSQYGQPPPGGGYTPAPGAPAPHGFESGGAAAKPPGTWIGVIVAVLMLGVSVLACLATGIVAANESESVAIQVSYVTVPAILGGLFPWIVALLLRTKDKPLAIGAPIGCGCATWLFGLVGTIVFYVGLWQSL